jgi:hypothetical protein
MIGSPGDAARDFDQLGSRAADQPGGHPELGPPLLGASVSEDRGEVTVGEAAMLSASPKRP